MYFVTGNPWQSEARLLSFYAADGGAKVIDGLVHNNFAEELFCCLRIRIYYYDFARAVAEFCLLRGTVIIVRGLTAASHPCVGSYYV